MIGDSMRSQSRQMSATLPLSIVLVIVVILGGSIRSNFIATAILEVLACGALIWCVMDTRIPPLSRAALWLLALILAAALLCVLQLVPIRHAMWSGLPGRENVNEVFKSLSVGAVEQPISLAPDRTLQGVLRLLPPLAVFIFAAKLSSKIPEAHLAWAVLLPAVLSGLLGIAQALAGDFPFLFLYGASNYGQASGFLEVVGHQSTLQIIAIPFVFLLFANSKSRFDKGDAFQGIAVLALAALLVMIASVYLSGSAIGCAVAISAALASFALLGDHRPGLAPIAGAMIVILGVVVLAYVSLTSPAARSLGIGNFGDESVSRQALYSGALKMVQDYWPVGAGLGSFETAYPAYEGLAAVSPAYASHAGNDYLEVAAELGLLGCLILSGIIVWWVVMTLQAWRAPQQSGCGLKRAASIAVGAVLVQSLFDFPARAEAISCLAALCMGAMASNYVDKLELNRAGTSDSRAFKHRHLEL